MVWTFSFKNAKNSRTAVFPQGQGLNMKVKKESMATEDRKSTNGRSWLYGEGKNNVEREKAESIQTANSSV